MVGVCQFNNTYSDILTHKYKISLKKEYMKPKVIVICGPTATGKSDFAVWLAQKIKQKTTQKIGQKNKTKNKNVYLSAEIISADSRQVYKGLDIGSGKITKKEMGGIPHYLLDVCSPKKVYSVDQFKTDAQKIITGLHAKNKLPIVCGGTGFYIDAVINNIQIPQVPPNPTLRKKLETKLTEELFLILKKSDARRASDIANKNEINNRVRIIRAIEIAKAIGKVPQLSTNPTDQSNQSLFDTVWIGLSVSPEKLKQNIEKRLIKRIKMGMFNEVRKLHAQKSKKGQGVSWKRLNELGLEYRYVALFLQNKITKQEMIEKLTNEIVKYSKRQMTWFKRNKNIIWIDPKQKSSTLKKVNEFLKT